MFKKLICLCLALSMTLGLFISAPFAHAASEMKTSDAGIALIKHYEGFSPTPYYDNGRYSIGYGTLCPSDKVDYYRKNPMSKEEADSELRKAVASFEEDVNAFIDRHGLTYEQHQFDALISLVYNCGSACLVNGETLIKTLTNDPDDNELIYALSIYSVAGGKRNIALVNRRLNEAHVFLNGEYMIRSPEHITYVLFDGNGGEVSTYNVQGYDAKQTAQIIPSATREGYVFLGWFTAKTGGQQVLVLDEAVKTMTLYAQWGEIPVEQPTEPEMPTEPGEPTEPEDPTEPENPTEPEEPTEPENPTEPEEPTEPETPTEPEEPTKPAFDPFEVIVIQDDVNIHFGAGLVYIPVYQVNICDKLTILEEPIELDGYHWGRCDRGWVILEHTNYFGAPVPDPNVKTYATIISDSLRIRAGAGTSYAIKGELTNGTRVQILETKTVNGVVWGRFDKGWICCSDEYVKLETVNEAPSTPSEPEEPDVPDEPDTPTPPVTVTKTYGTVTCTSLCIRTGAGTNFAYIDELPNGAKVEILETKTVNGTVWGRMSRGWICITGYVKLETVTVSTGGTTEPEKPNTPETPQPPATTTKTYATVVYSFLRIRAGAGTNYAYRGQLSKGDRVEILETKRVGSDLWGRIDRGWICCIDEYVKLETVTVSTGGTTKPNTPSEPQKPTVVTKTYATVVYSFLRIRAGAGTNYAYRGQLNKGDRVEILETKRVGGELWGRFEKGWICCIDEYVKLETVTVSTGGTAKPETPDNSTPSQPTTKTYGTVTCTSLRIRTGAGTNYPFIGELPNGAKVEILETKAVNGTVWGRISKGWICISGYVKLETATGSKPSTETPKQETGIITATSLNVRSGAGTNYATVGLLWKGTKVVILEKKTVNGTVWGRTSKGWICMDYVALT